MRIHIVQDVLKRSNIIVILHRVNIIVHSDISYVMLFEIDVDIITSLDVVSTQTTEILRNNRINLSSFYVFQKLLEAWPLEIESGKPIVNIIIKDAEPILFTELAQHHLLRFYTHTFTDLFVVLAQAAINSCYFDIEITSLEKRSIKNAIKHGSLYLIICLELP